MSTDLPGLEQSIASLEAAFPDDPNLQFVDQRCGNRDCSRFVGKQEVIRAANWLAIVSGWRNIAITLIDRGRQFFNECYRLVYMDDPPSSPTIRLFRHKAA